MEELDLLKKDWNKKDNYPKVTEEKIYGMLLKSSSSAVKWIFIISILEFLFGIFLNVGMQFTKANSDTTELLKNSGVYTFYQIGSVLIWAVSIYFIYKFYVAYRKISITDSIKQLMESILTARNTVRQYIIFNLGAGAVFLLIIYSFVIQEILGKIALKQHKVLTTPTYVFAFIGVIAVTALIIFIFWLVYKILYGFLLRRLKKNYDELKKIDL